MSRGSAAGFRGVDLAAHLAELRRNPLEAERRVDVLLALAGEPAVVVDREQSVLVQFEAEADRAVAQRDVVALGSGEVLHGGAAAVGGDEPEIGLETALQEHARFGLALAEHAFDEAVVHEVVHQRRRRARCEQIEIAAGVAAAPAGCRPASMVASGARSRRCSMRAAAASCASRQQMPAGEALPLLQGFEDEGFLLRTHSFQRPDAAIPGGGLEIVERANTELAVQHRDRLRPYALKVEQVENRRRELGNELAVKRGIAGLGDFTNPGGEILADAGDFAKAVLVEEYQVVRVIGGDVGGVAIRANLERVVVLDLEQIRNLPEDPVQWRGYPTRRPSVSISNSSSRAPPAASDSAMADRAAGGP